MKNENPEIHVLVDGKVIARINERMLQERGRSEKLPLIKKLHQIRYQVIQVMKSVHDSDGINENFLTYVEIIRQIDFLLQDAWGFSRDERYHQFWELPGCLCPKIDNEDRWPTGYYVINQECPIHGKRHEIK